MKSFNDRPESSKRVDFAMSWWSNASSIEHRHEFRAYPSIDAFSLAEINRAVTGKAGVATLNAVSKMDHSIRAMLDDSDGTPLEWEAAQLPSPVDATDGWPSADGDVSEKPAEAADDVEPQFLAPDGSIRPLSEAPKFLEFAEGSSLRRWSALMDEDNRLVVAAPAMTKAWRWLVGEAANRPTVR